VWRPLLRLVVSLVLAAATYWLFIGAASLIGNSLPAAITFAVYISPLAGGPLVLLLLAVVYFVVLTKKSVFAGAKVKSGGGARDV